MLSGHLMCDIGIISSIGCGSRLAMKPTAVTVDTPLFPLHIIKTAVFIEFKRFFLFLMTLWNAGRVHFAFA